MPPAKSRKPLVISIAVLVLLGASYFAIADVRNALDNAWQVLTSGDSRAVEHWVSGFGWFGPLLIVLVMVLQMFLIIIPSWLLMIVAILAYGPVWGSLIVFCGIFAASSVGFFIGKYLSDDVTTRLIGPRNQKKVSGLIDRYGLWAIVITRINPLLSNDAISFIAGLLQMGYRKFILATLAGIAPLIIFIAWLGEIGDTLTTGLLWLSVISLVSLGAFIWYDKRMIRKSGNGRRED